jgi:hypothetical protein
MSAFAQRLVCPTGADAVAIKIVKLLIVGRRLLDQGQFTRKQVWCIDLVVATSTGAIRQSRGGLAAGSGQSRRRVSM